MSSAKKISQQELRQMMKERKQIQSKLSRETTQSTEVKTEEKKIESPLARYDINGHISCILCEQHIASGNLWSQHISSRTHKNKIEEMKRKKMLLKSIQTKNDVKSQSISTKREEVKTNLKRKLETNDKQIIEKLAKNNVDIKVEKSDDISSDLMETEDSSDTKSVPVDSEMTSVLPKDFFDDTKEEGNVIKRTTDSNNEGKNIGLESNCLPKGFFDDPVMDAKARKVVYKNPIDEQWEQFQKVIAEENNVSENIIEEDIEELQIDRNLEEIEEQIANWIKVNEMQKRAEMLHDHILKNSTNGLKQEDSDSDVDEHDLNIFSNWRSRTALK